MSICKNCLKILVCKYNDGHNLFCKEEYECPHFLDISVLEKQIPKKPKRDKEGCLVCGNCGSFDGIRIDTGFNEGFCYDCGQAIDRGECDE